MFTKTSFQKAASEIAKAESEVRRRREILAQTELAIDRATQEKCAADQAATTAAEQDVDVAALESKLDEISTVRDRMERRIEEFRRLRAHQTVILRQAQIDLLDAESGAHAAQRSFFEAAEKEALQKCVQQCREPLLELQRFSAAAAYHRALPFGKSEAQIAWNGVDAIDALRVALKGFDEQLSWDEKIKNAPPVAAVCSEEITTTERDTATSLKKKGELSAQKLTADLTVRESPQKAPSNSNDLQQALYQIENWQSEVERIEVSIKEERIREYPTFHDGVLVDRAGIRKRKLEELQRKLDHARACLSNWQGHLDNKAA